MPKEEIRRIEEFDEIAGFLSQSNISERNLARWLLWLLHWIRGVAQFAALVLEIGKTHPRKRNRMKFLVRSRRDLVAGLSQYGLAWLPEPTLEIEDMDFSHASSVECEAN